MGPSVPFNIIPNAIERTGHLLALDSMSKWIDDTTPTIPITMQQWDQIQALLCVLAIQRGGVLDIPKASIDRLPQDCTASIEEVTKADGERTVRISIQPETVKGKILIRKGA